MTRRLSGEGYHGGRVAEAGMPDGGEVGCVQERIGPMDGKR